MSNISSSAALMNVTFSTNSATSYGGGMFNDDSSPTLTNVTFSNNSANFGGGVYDLFDTYSSSPTLKNCILWGNTASIGAQIFNETGCSTTVSYSDVQGGWSGTGNLNADPLLASLGSYGGTTQTMALLPGSPAINAGTTNGAPSTDQRGFLRDANPDMGAYEFEGVAYVTSSQANGAYTNGTVIPIQVTFSQPVHVTGQPRLLLNTGAVVAYSSGDGTATLTFSYTVAAGENTADLDFASITALYLKSKDDAIKDFGGYDMPLTLPTPAGTGSLGANKSILIDTAAPNTPSITATLANPTNSTSATFTFAASDPIINGASSGVALFEYWLNGGSHATVTATNGSATVNLSSLPEGSYTFYVAAQDVAGNKDLLHNTASYSWVIDRQTSLLVTPASGTYGGTTVLQATLTWHGNGAALSGETIAFTINGTDVGNAATDIHGMATLANVSLAGLNVGTYPTAIGASFAGDPGYSGSSGSASLTVNPAVLTVTTADQTKVYGTTFTAFTGTLDGLRNGDNIAAAYSSLGAAANAPVKTPPYDIVASLSDPNGKLGNYNVVYHVGHLTVTPAPLTVTAADQSKVYGTTFTAFTGTIVGLCNGDNITATYASAGAAAGAPVVDPYYAITATLSDPNGRLSNYNVVYHVGHLTVTPAPLTVTAADQSKVYGTTFSAFTGTIDGLRNGDTITVAYSSPGAAADAPVVDPYYDITATLGDPNGKLGNYNVTYHLGHLTVTPAPLTVTAADQSKVYGTTFSAFTGTIDGLRNGDTITVAYSSPGAAADAPVVDPYYDITATLGDPSGKLGNYNVIYHLGHLTVTARPVTVTANPQTKVYGDPDLDLMYQVTSGSLVNGDHFSGTLRRVAGENVGSYAIGQGSLTLSTNYSLSYVGANLAITARPITVWADPQSKVYGDADPALTYQVISGSLVNHDSFSGALTRVAGENVGDYAIGQGSLALSANYSLSYFGANLTIRQAPLTVTPADQSKVYGTTFTAFTGTLAGLRNSDNITATYSSPGAAADAPVTGGSYAINATLHDPTGKLGNYIVTNNVGLLTVTRASAVITITGFSGKADGLAHPATGTATGVLGENLNSLLSFRYDPGGSSAPVKAGHYTATAVFAGSGNYLPDATHTASIDISPAAAKQVRWLPAPLIQPAGKLAPVQIEVVDKYGNRVTTSKALVTVTIVHGPGGFGAGSTRSVKAVQGVATFTNLILPKAGTYVLKASATSLTSALTPPVTIQAAAAFQLGFVQGPAGQHAGRVLSPVVVQVQDRYGNAVAAEDVPVTLQLVSGTLNGTQTEPTDADGKATFSDLSIPVAGRYRLEATGTGLLTALSKWFVILAP